MRLEQRDKELAAIGASVGANCRPCIEYHLRAGREAGLSGAELADAVATGRAVRDEAVELLASRIDELLGGAGAAGEPGPTAPTSRDHELVALGASVGANSHPLLRRHMAAGLAVGLTPTETRAAADMALHVQQRAGQMTATEAKDALGELEARAGAVAVPS